MEVQNIQNWDTIGKTFFYMGLFVLLCLATLIVSSTPWIILTAAVLGSGVWLMMFTTLKYYYDL